MYMYFVCTTQPKKMHSKVMRHRYICQKSPAYPRYVLIDTSIEIIYSKMDKQYINILHAPNRTGVTRRSFKQQIEIIYKLENTICTTAGNKLTLLDDANGKAVCRMSQISQPFLSTKILILQLCLRAACSNDHLYL